MIGDLIIRVLPVATPDLAALITGTMARVSLDVFILVAVIILISLILVVFGALYLSREFSRPLNTLLEATGHLAEGDLDVRLESSRQDEFGGLALGFNRMAAQLKKARGELQEANVALENRVAQRTAELEVTNLELQASATKMQETMRVKSEFLANISHELLTPLHAMLGYAELLHEGIYGPLSEKQNDAVRRMENSAQTLRRLINDIIELARIETGRTTLTVEPFDAAEMLQDVLDSLRAVYGKKDLALRGELAPDLTEFRTDRGKVQHVLFNLLSNAMKFTEQGSVTLLVRREADGEHAVLEIRDTGPGIAAEKLETVFEEFRQLDGSTTRRAGGAGIGLPLTKQLVEILGGEISVESRVGEGTTFRVILPVALDVSAPPRRDALLPNTSFRAMPAAGGHSRIVLAVDDDEELLELLVAVLEPAGYEVITCLDGDAAIAKARELTPYAVTLDIRLPQRDGWSVLRELKAVPETSSIPVIVLSVIDDRALGEQLGAHGYLTKPFDRKRLLEELDAINDNHLVH